jgi:peroxiredoxin
LSGVFGFDSPCRKVLPDLAGLGPASKRAAFVIDKTGIIRYSEETLTPGDLPNFAAIIEVLQTL